MSTLDAHSTTPTLVRFRLPEPPPRELDDVTSYRHVHLSGNPHFLAQHLGNPETTLISAEYWIIAAPGVRPLRQPDLLIAFDVDPDLYYEQNGYVISDQGKPPDFILEVASKSTAKRDLNEKRDDYAAFGVTEYWRYDFTGEYYGTSLAGDRLVDGRYEPIEITELAPGVLQGQSDVLGLWLRWEQDNLLLGWHDPATGKHIPNFLSEREARLAEHAALIAERNALMTEREARLAAERRVQALEAELQRRRDPKSPT